MTLQEINHTLNGKIIGETNLIINGVGEPDRHKIDDIIIISEERMLKQNKIICRALVIPKKLKEKTKDKYNLIVVKNIKKALIQIITIFNKQTKYSFKTQNKYSKSSKIGKNTTIGDFTYIGKNTTIKNGTVIYPNCFIGDNVIIGKNCQIKANVYIGENSIIRNNVIINAGVVIGCDGFGFLLLKDKIEKIPHIGKVIIEDNVEIGANTTIDKATISETVIGKGTKIDNQVQIAHNVRIGKNCRIAGLTALAGSVEIGNNCLIAGFVGIKEHTKIASNTIIGGKSGVTKNVESEGNFILGYPAQKYEKEMKDKVLIRKLNGLFRRVKTIEKEIENKRKH